MRVRNEPIFLLTWTAGCLDAMSYLGLGHVFTANMTGNTVLLGLALGQAQAASALHSAIALAGFCLGGLAGTLLVERNQHPSTWTPQLTTALALEGVLLVLFAVAWLLTGANPRAGVGLRAMIALAALAMGLQSAIVGSLGVTGIATTYLTGTLTTLMAQAVHWLRWVAGWATGSKATNGTQANPPGLGRLAVVVGIYLFAALLTAGTVVRFPFVAVLLPLLAVIVVVLDAYVRQHSQHPWPIHQEETGDTR
jgi:uncharacterized membrane protein YoaK (UPF0700 family)